MIINSIGMISQIVLEILVIVKPYLGSKKRSNILYMSLTVFYMIIIMVNCVKIVYSYVYYHTYLKMDFR